MIPTFVDDMNFAYQQYNVYDALQNVGFSWSEDQLNQGFVRNESSVSFRTLLDFGIGKVRAFVGPFSSEAEYGLAIAVPFLVRVGNVAIEGPEEILIVDRKIRLDPGNYRLVSAQSVKDEDTLLIDVFFEKLLNPVTASEILISHSTMNPPSKLIESADSSY